MAGILELLEQSGLKVALAAPTGRAAKRLAEVTHREARTIHRLLEIDPASTNHAFKHNEKNLLRCDAVIVDEMSMGLKCSLADDPVECVARGVGLSFDYLDKLVDGFINQTNHYQA